MMRWLFATVLLLTVNTLAWAELKIVGPLTVEPTTLVRLTAETESKDAQFLWDVTPAASIEECGKKLLFTGKPGTYQVSVTAVDFTAKTIERARVQVVIGEVPPGPGPIPPGPGPGPVPPGPVPIPGEGLRVLIVEETADRTKLPVGQQAIILGQGMRDYLNANTPLGPDGKMHEWRIFDKDQAMDGASTLWKDAMKRERKSVPWIVVSNGKAGFEGPLPENPEKVIELLKKYGGK